MKPTPTITVGVPPGTSSFFPPPPNKNLLHYFHEFRTPCPIYDSNDIVQQPANLTTMNDQFVDSALQFMEKSNNARQPFFLYFASFHSHYPPFSASRFFNTSIRGFYGDAMTELDWTVGQIMDKLTSLGLDKNTLVFFSSDNGPELGRGLYSGSAGLLQCGKGTIYEGIVLSSHSLALSLAHSRSHSLALLLALSAINSDSQQQQTPINQ